MALTVRGLGLGDLGEVVDCLLLGAAVVDDTAPGLAGYRRDLADRIGDALDELPGPPAVAA